MEVYDLLATAAAIILEAIVLLKYVAYADGQHKRDRISRIKQLRHDECLEDSAKGMGGV